MYTSAQLLWALNLLRNMSKLRIFTLLVIITLQTLCGTSCSYVYSLTHYRTAHTWLLLSVIWFLDLLHPLFRRSRNAQVFRTAVCWSQLCFLPPFHLTTDRQRQKGSNRKGKIEWNNVSTIQSLND